MVKYRCIPLDSPAEWKFALTGLRHAFAHTWENCYAMYLTTGFPTYLYCFESGDTRIVCPLAERTFDGYVDIVTPYGFSGFTGNRDCPTFQQHWKSFVREKGYVCGYSQLNPLLENSTYFDQSEVYRYNTLYILDLSQDLEEIYTRLDKSRKKQIRKLMSATSNIILDQQSLTEFLRANFSEFFERKNASGTYRFSQETLSFLCQAEGVLLIGAGSNAKVDAVSMAAHTADIGDAFIQISTPAGRRYAVEMVWHRLLYLKSLGIPYLNLGGGIRENDSVAKFKEQFGGKKLALGCLKQIYEPAIYRKLCQNAGVDSESLNGYFPAYQNPAGNRYRHSSTRTSANDWSETNV